MPRRRGRRKSNTNRLVSLRKGAKSYSSVNTYISAYYKKNKKYIDANISDVWLDTPEANGDPYKAFKNLIHERMSYTNPKTGNKYTVEQAINREKNSLDLRKNWSTADIYANNFLSKIKSTTDLKKNIINKSKSEKITYEQTFYKTEIDENGKKVKVAYKQKITKLKSSFSVDKISFEGYFTVDGESAIVYSYDDVYIIEYISPKAGVGATFKVVAGDEFKNKLGKSIFFIIRRKRS